MVRRIEKYVCKDCGHEFIGMDMEWNCTASSYPVRCPKCGSTHTSPKHTSTIGKIIKALKSK